MQTKIESFSTSLSQKFDKLKIFFIKIFKDKEISEDDLKKIQPTLKVFGYKYKNFKELKKFIKECLAIQSYIQEMLNYEVLSINYQEKENVDSKSNPDFLVILLSGEKIIIEVIAAISKYEKQSKEIIKNSCSKNKLADNNQNIYPIYNYHKIEKIIDKNNLSIPKADYILRIAACCEIISQIDQKSYMTYEKIKPVATGRNFHAYVNFVINQSKKTQDQTFDLTEFATKYLPNKFTFKEFSDLFNLENHYCLDLKKNVIENFYCSDLEKDIFQLDIKIKKFLSENIDANFSFFELISLPISYIEDILKSQNISCEFFELNQNFTQKTLQNFYFYLKILSNPQNEMYLEENSLQKLIEFWSQNSLLNICYQYCKAINNLEKIQKSFKSFLRKKYFINFDDLTSWIDLDPEEYIAQLLKKAIDKKFDKYKEESSDVILP